jgi:hypothetical protein
MYSLPANYPSLNLRGVCGVVPVKQVPEVEGAGTASRFPLQCPEPFTLGRPAPVQSPLLAEDVRTELAAGQMRDQMSPVYQRAIRIGGKRKSALVGDVTLAGSGWRYGPGCNRAILLFSAPDCMNCTREHSLHTCT